MKHIVYAFALACSFGSFLSCSSPEIGEKNVNIIPAPAHVQVDSGVFALSSKTSISYADKSLKGLAEELAAYISALTQIAVTIDQSATSSSSNCIYLALIKDQHLFSEIPAPFGLSAKDGNPEDEFYTLSVKKKNILIKAAAHEGIYRGITSLKQLIGGNITVKGELLHLPVIDVKDYPRYAWRGLSLDVSRCFFSVEEVKQVIDMLSLYKMNVLHIHLTDNQGWRIEIKKYPKLTEVGSKMPNNGRQGGYYTQEQFKDIVKYASDRFITIVPEIDLPGHFAAIIASYPEFKNAINLDLKMNIPGQALGALDVDDANTMQFVEDVITELAAMTPGSYIHIGGDETMGLSEDKFIRFVNQTKQFVLNTGKKIVGWQETARADISAGDVFQFWFHFSSDLDDQENNFFSSLPKELSDLFAETFKKAGKDLESGITKNAKVILSPGSFAYLDHRYLEPSVDSSQTALQEKLGLSVYSKQTIEQMYNWDPTNYNPILNPTQHIAGVEGAIWCETITNFHELQFMLMPRLAGVAEKGWSKVEETNWEEYKIRLSTHAPLWRQANWNYFKSSLVDWK